MTKQRILVVDDDEGVCYALRRELDRPGREVRAVRSATEAFDAVAQWKPDLVLMDIKMPAIDGLTALKRIKDNHSRQLVVLMTAYGTTETAIEAMKRGAFDYVMKPFDDVGALEGVVGRALEAARLMKSVQAPGAPAEPAAVPESDQIIGRSAAMQEVYKLIGQVARSDVPVLIRGESGTGKELVARAIYQHGRRAGGPFVAVNCAAIPDNLLESELFGHEKGAFTGAETRRIGRFEAAGGGTIFLDEVGDMSLPTQAKILRVLQDGTFERVGGSATMGVNVRVIAATNRDLEKAVAEGSFREDLYYRLKVMQIVMPPLRERPEDIPELAEYFIRRFAPEVETQVDGLSDRARDLLKRYSWPGNVRQLENVIRRALVVERGVRLTPESLALSAEPALGAVSGGNGAPESTAPAPVPSPASPEEAMDHLVEMLLEHHTEDLMNELQRLLVTRALEKMSGNQVQTSKLLGISRNTLRGRIEEYGLAKKVTIRRRGGKAAEEPEE
jgi:nitrogen regulation protein NR(I)